MSSFFSIYAFLLYIDFYRPQVFTDYASFLFVLLHLKQRRSVCLIKKRQVMWSWLGRFMNRWEKKDCFRIQFAFACSLECDMRQSRKLRIKYKLWKSLKKNAIWYKKDVKMLNLTHSTQHLDQKKLKQKKDFFFSWSEKKFLHFNLRSISILEKCCGTREVTHLKLKNSFTVKPPYNDTPRGRLVYLTSDKLQKK